jgi:hypothetical protein
METRARLAGGVRHPKLSHRRVRERLIEGRLCAPDPRPVLLAHDAVRRRSACGPAIGFGSGNWNAMRSATGPSPIPPTTENLGKKSRPSAWSAAEITDVVLTHGHPDRIGGVLDAGGKPAFPNACYRMSKIEWDFWTSPSARQDVAMDAHMKAMRVGCAQKNLPPLNPQMELIERAGEILPGLDAIPAPGHTPGQLLHMENPAGGTSSFSTESTAVETRQRFVRSRRVRGMEDAGLSFSVSWIGRTDAKRRRLAMDRRVLARLLGGGRKLGAGSAILALYVEATRRAEDLLP